MSYQKLNADQLHAVSLPVAAYLAVVSTQLEKDRSVMAAVREVSILRVLEGEALDGRVAVQFLADRSVSHMNVADLHATAESAQREVDARILYTVDNPFYQQLMRERDAAVALLRSVGKDLRELGFGDDHTPVDGGDCVETVGEFYDDLTRYMTLDELLGNIEVQYDADREAYTATFDEVTVKLAATTELEAKEEALLIDWQSVDPDDEQEDEDEE